MKVLMKGMQPCYPGDDALRDSETHPHAAPAAALSVPGGIACPQAPRGRRTLYLPNTHTPRMTQHLTYYNDMCTRTF